MIILNRETIAEYCKESEIDYVVQELEKDPVWYLDTWIKGIVKYKNYNRGQLEEGMLIEFQGKPWECTEMSKVTSYMKIESINDSEVTTICVTAHVRIL